MGLIDMIMMTEYVAWHHRRWIHRTAFSVVGRLPALSADVRQCRVSRVLRGFVVTAAGVGFHDLFGAMVFSRYPDRLK